MASLQRMGDQSLDTQLAYLRAELKEWERAFAAENDGRKAGREDIKKDQNIAAKYKLYTKLRESTKPGKQNEKTRERDHILSRKRSFKHDNEPLEGYRADSHPFATPKKVSKHSPTSGNTTTPLRQNNAASQNSDQLHPSQLDPYISPSHFRTLFTPSQTKYSVSPLPFRAAIGPTPQRDGKALGLFDLLSVSGGSTATAATPSGKKRKAIDIETPSRSNDAQKNDSNWVDNNGLPSTPSAQRSCAGALRARRYSLTPASSGKKFYLSKFFGTPTVGSRFATIPEDEEGDEDGTNNAPKYTPKNGKEFGLSPELETPSFLRRRNIFSSRNASHRGAVEKRPKTGFSPIGVRMPPRVMGKGLSVLVQGLRDIEEEQMEDDLDALREMEAGGSGHGSYGDNTLVKDSQVITRSGPDDREEGAETPLRSCSWKKIGQKRTTKLVIMKPNRAKPKPPLGWETIMEKEGSGGELATAAVDAAESRVASNGLGDKRHSAGPSDDVDTESCVDNDNDNRDFAPEESILDALSKSRLRIQEVAKTAEKSSIESTDSKTKKTAGKLKKVKPESHANYRALKIRSRGSGRASRFGGRFGRR